VRVVHVIPSLRKGGAERLCLDIVRGLNALPDMEAKLAIMRDINEYAEEYPDVTPVVINSRVVPSILGKWEIELKAWDSFIQEFRPDVIHSHLFEAEMMTRSNIVSGTQYFTHCHDNMPQIKRFQWNEVLSKQRITESYERSFLIGRYEACGNRFIAISADTEQYFKANLPSALACNVVRTPNAIDHSRFSANTASAPNTGGVLRLINIGSFVPKKNQRFLLQVLHHLRNEGLNASFTLVGDGAMREQVQLEALALGLGDHVRFLGNVSNVESLLWESHVYVHSATYEPFGLVILEAMAAGLPVVALDGRGNRELHQDGLNGYMVREQDPATFASRILACTSDGSAWQCLHTNAIEFSRAYDMETYVQRLVSLYGSKSEFTSH
jgi:glycosyltransferase involved in cell wall biosynthesis